MEVLVKKYRGNDIVAKIGSNSKLGGQVSLIEAKQFQTEQ